MAACLSLHHCTCGAALWAAQYVIRPLIELTPAGVVFSLLSFLVLFTLRCALQLAVAPVQTQVNQLDTQVDELGADLKKLELSSKVCTLPQG